MGRREVGGTQQQGRLRSAGGGSSSPSIALHDGRRGVVDAGWPLTPQPGAE